MPPAYEILLLNTAVPQIQAAQAGDTYVVPRDIQITANLDVTGNTILGNASTDTVRVNGYMGVGGLPSADTGIYLTNTALTGTAQVGVLSSITGSSSATTRIVGFNAFVGSAAASFTVADLVGFRASTLVKGAGSTVTNTHGVLVLDQTQGTNNYGITSLVSSGTDKWNIYASGTAANYFAGNVGIGTTTTGIAGAKLILGGSGTDFTGVRIINSSTNGRTYDIVSAGQSAYYDIPAGAFGIRDITGSVTRFTLSTTEAVFNDPGNDYDFRVESDTNTHALFVQGSDGFVGIGTSTPARTLHVENSSGNLLQLKNSSTANGSYSLVEFITAGGANNQIRGVQQDASNSYFTFYTKSGGVVGERLRIDSSGNVGIGTSSPNASAILDAQSTTKGVRMPNMTTTQKNAIVSPAAGLIVFDTTLAKLCVYSGSAWETITSL